MVTSRAEEEIATNMTAGETRSCKRLVRGENMKGASQDFFFMQRTVLMYRFGSGLVRYLLTVLDCNGCSRIYNRFGECKVYDRAW